MAEQALSQPHDLPVGPIGRSGPGWWGVATLIASEASLFAYLLFAYYYTGATGRPGWLLEPAPKLFPGLPNTALLIASSFVALYGEKGVEKGDRRQALIGIGGAFVMGAIFALVQCYEWSEKHYGIAANSYASLYFTTTGLHMAHVGRDDVVAINPIRAGELVRPLHAGGELRLQVAQVLVGVAGRPVATDEVTFYVFF